MGKRPERPVAEEFVTNEIVAEEFVRGQRSRPGNQASKPPTLSRVRSATTCGCWSPSCSSSAGSSVPWSRPARWRAATPTRPATSSSGRRPRWPRRCNWRSPTRTTWLLNVGAYVVANPNASQADVVHWSEAAASHGPLPRRPRLRLHRDRPGRRSPRLRRRGQRRPYPRAPQRTTAPTRSLPPGDESRSTASRRPFRPDACGGPAAEFPTTAPTGVRAAPRRYPKPRTRDRASTHRSPTGSATPISWP